MQDLGRTLMALGILLVVLGALLSYADQFSFLRLGRLPGDIQIKRESFSFYFPLTTCMLVSAVLSVLYHLFRK